MREAVTGVFSDGDRGPARLTPYLLRRDAEQWRQSLAKRKNRLARRDKGRKLGARLMALLAEWFVDRGLEGLLYRGARLGEAERLIRENPGMAVGEEAVLFIAASVLRQRNLWRAFTMVATLVSTVLLVITTIAWFQRNLAVERRNRVLRNQSLYLAGVSQKEVEVGDAELGIKLTLEALPLDRSGPDRPYVPLAEVALNQAIAAYGDLPVLLGNTDAVTPVVFLPDGRILSGSKDGTIRVWGSEKSAEILRGHKTEITELALGPEGRRLVSLSKDGDARLWDLGKSAVDKGSPIADFPIKQVAFSPDGSFLLTVSQESVIHIHAIASKEITATLPRPTTKINTVSTTGSCSQRPWTPPRDYGKWQPGTFTLSCKATKMRSGKGRSIPLGDAW